jgi:glycosyltransferase involved in cell wall biosynthesis
MTLNPVVTVAIPSYNQGKYIEQAILSVINQDIAMEIFVVDGGSQDESINIIKKYEDKLSGWRSHPDNGQSAAINEALLKGSAPYVCWLNSDDWFLPGALKKLAEVLDKNPTCPAAYAKAWNIRDIDKKCTPVWVEPFDEKRLAKRCIISQPATLIRRSSFEKIGGINEDLHMVMDYDLWWRLFKKFGPLIMLDEVLAVNREHEDTKTATNRKLHYQEAIQIIKKYNIKVPIKWWVYQPYAVWYKTLISK